MKKIIIFGMITALFLTVNVVASAAGNTNLGKDYCVYLSGPDKSGDKSTLNMTGSPVIYGNAVVKSGSYLLTKTWGDKNITNGMLYPNTGVNLSPAVTGWARDQILGQGITAPQGDYSVQIPQISNKAFPSLPQKGDLNVVNQNVTISENGWYTNINIGGNPNTLTIDTTGGKTIHIRADQFSINGNMNIIGDGKVFLYVDTLTLGGTVNMNAANGAFGNSQKLFIYLSGSSPAPIFNTSVTIAGALFAPNSDLDLGGSVKIKGNIYAGGSFKFGNSAVITGLVDVPNADIYMSGSAVLNGALIAKTLEMDGSAVINKADYPGYDFLVDDVVTQQPEDPTDPGDTDTYHPGILGAYYDASDFKNDSALRMERIDSNIAFNYMLGSPDEVIEPESFAIRWTGYIKPEVTGDYRFKTYSDDGVKVTIDGKCLIDRWGLLSLDYTVAADTIHLEAGTYYPITVEYQQLPVIADIFLFWEADGVPMSLVPESVFFVKDAVYQEYKNTKFLNVIDKSGNGLKNVFYTLDENGDKAQEYTEVNLIDYNWGLGAPGNIKDDVFYGTMDGQLETRFTEPLILKFAVDDGIKVWIDDQLVVDEWGTHSIDTFTYTLNAVAGHKYKIHIEYVDMGIGATCVMYWESALQDIQVVPKKYLYSN